MQYEIRKWIIKPVLKEVIGRFDNEKEVKEYIQTIKEFNNFNIDEINENIEIHKQGHGIIKITEEGVELE